MKVKNIEVNGEVYELPQKTSDLVNDKNYTTHDEVVEIVNNALVNTLNEIEYGTY